MATVDRFSLMRQEVLTKIKTVQSFNGRLNKENIFLPIVPTGSAEKISENKEIFSVIDQQSLAYRKRGKELFKNFKQQRKERQLIEQRKKVLLEIQQGPPKLTKIIIVERRIEKSPISLIMSSSEFGKFHRIYEFECNYRTIATFPAFPNVEMKNPGYFVEYCLMVFYKLNPGGKITKTINDMRHIHKTLSEGKPLTDSYKKDHVLVKFVKFYQNIKRTMDALIKLFPINKMNTVYEDMIYINGMYIDILGTPDFESDDTVFEIKSGKYGSDNSKFYQALYQTLSYKMLSGKNAVLINISDGKAYQITS